MKGQRPDTRGTTPFVEPFLHALNRMQERERLRPSQYIDRARALLIDRLGAVDEPTEAAFAHGAVGIQADHTHYFNGFALMRPMKRGIAVALRHSGSTESILVLENEGSASSVAGLSPPHSVAGSTDSGSPDSGSPATRSVVSGESPFIHDLVELLGSIARAFSADETRGLEMAVVGSVPPRLQSTYRASLVTAFSRALGSLDSLPHSSESHVVLGRKGIEDHMGHGFSTAYLIGSQVADTDPFLLIDTKNGERLSLDVPDKEQPGWALIDTGSRCVDDSLNRFNLADKALASLVDGPFPEIDSFRDLAHRDLETAVSSSPRKLRPVIRYLVSENQRVQKLVAAIQNRDWQLFGALMAMSHALRSTEWSVTSADQDWIVGEAERFSMEGVYGATQTGEGPFIVVLGQLFSLPAFLDHISNEESGQTTSPVDTFML